MVNTMAINNICDQKKVSVGKGAALRKYKGSIINPDKIN